VSSGGHESCGRRGKRASCARAAAAEAERNTRRFLKSRAIEIFNDLTKTRVLLFAQRNEAIPMPFLSMLVFWLTIIFASFSLFAPPNPLVLCNLGHLRDLFNFAIRSAVFRPVADIQRTID
jgi:hypothetical protein